MTQANNLPLVAFDLETTGLSPRQHAILEIGAVKFDLAGNVLDEYQQLACPGDALSPTIVDLTGITDDMVRDCPPPTQVAQDFLRWAGDDALFLAHNAPFDQRFLIGALLSVTSFAPTLPVVDTLKWARSLGLAVPDHKLATLLAHFELPAQGMHRSLADAQGVMALALRMLKDCPDPKTELARRIDLPQPAKPAKLSSWPEYER